MVDLFLNSLNLDLRTAIMVQGNEISIFPYMDSTGKWGYELCYLRDRGLVINERPFLEPHKLITCSPVYSSERDSQEAGDRLTQYIKQLDLSSHKKELSDLLKDQIESVQKVIDLTNNPL